MRFTLISLFTMTLALAAAGCDQQTDHRVPVSGTVLIDGEPLTSGMIRFVPEVGRPSSSAILTDGSFDLASERVNQISESGVRPGSYRVQVSSSKIIDDETIQWQAPQKYADFRTSGLDVTISKPTEGLVIELTWDGAGPEDSEGAASDEEPAEKSKASHSPPADDVPAGEGKGA